jgi:multiple sugar transport system substrate-binding protein
MVASIREKQHGGLSRRAALAGLGGLAAVVGAACGRQASAPGGSAPATEPTARVGPAEIVFITPAGAGLEQDLYTGFLNDFMKAYPQITVKYSWEEWGAYPPKLKTLLAAGQVPDMVHQHFTVVRDFASLGALADLKPFTRRDGVQDSEFVTVLLEIFSLKGKQIALPKDSAGWGIYYNKDMFDKAGVKYPDPNWTWEQFLETCRGLTRPEEKSFAISNWRIRPDSEQHLGVLRAFGGGFYNDELTRSIIDSDASTEALQFFADLELKHKVTPQANGFQFQGDAFRNQVVALTSGFHSTAFFIKAEKKEFKYDVVPYPRGRGGQFVPVGASGWAVPEQAPHREHGWLLVKFLTGKDVQSSIARGKRWGASRPDSLDELMPDDGVPANARQVHIDPLKGKGPVQPLAYAVPVGHIDILQAWDTEFEPLYQGQRTAKEAAQAARPQIDAILARNKM